MKQYKMDNYSLREAPINRRYLRGEITKEQRDKEIRELNIAYGAEGLLAIFFLIAPVLLGIILYWAGL